VGGLWFLIITKMHFLPLNQAISAHHFVFAAFDEEEKLQLIHHFAPPILNFYCIVPLDIIISYHHLSIVLIWFPFHVGSS
jgi:hypothetical protein